MKHRLLTKLRRPESKETCEQVRCEYYCLSGVTERELSVGAIIYCIIHRYIIGMYT